MWRTEVLPNFRRRNQEPRCLSSALVPLVAFCLTLLSLICGGCELLAASPLQFIKSPCMQQASSSMTVPGLFHSNEGGVQGQKTYVEQGRRVKIGAIVSEMEGIIEMHGRGPTWSEVRSSLVHPKTLSSFCLQVCRYLICVYDEQAAVSA